MSNGDLNIEVSSEAVKEEIVSKNGSPTKREVGQSYWSLVKHQYRKTNWLS